MLISFLAVLLLEQDWDSTNVRTVRLKKREKRVRKLHLHHRSSAVCFPDL